MIEADSIADMASKQSISFKYFLLVLKKSILFVFKFAMTESLCFKLIVLLIGVFLFI